MKDNHPVSVVALWVFVILTVVGIGLAVASAAGYNEPKYSVAFTGDIVVVGTPHPLFSVICTVVFYVWLVSLGGAAVVASRFYYEEVQEERAIREDEKAAELAPAPAPAADGHDYW